MRNSALSAVLLVGLASVAAGEPAATFRVRTIPVKGQPTHLLVHQDRLFVSSFPADELTVIDRGTRKPVRVQGDTPGESIVANGKVFVGLVFDKVAVLDRGTLKEVRRLPLVGDGCFAASPDGKTVYYATNSRNEFHIIDTETCRIRTVPYPSGGRGIGHGSVALAPDGKRLYLGIQRGQGPNGNCFLAVYDLAKDDYVGTIALFQTDQAGNSDDSIPAGMTFSPDGRLLYVGMMQCLVGVRVVDTQALRIANNVWFQPGPQNKHFTNVDPLEVATFRDWLLCVNRNNSELVVVDRATTKALARLTFPDGGQPMRTIAVEEDRLYLGGNQSVHELNGRKLARLIERAGRDAVKTPLEIKLKPR